MPRPDSPGYESVCGCPDYTRARGRPTAAGRLGALIAPAVTTGLSCPFCKACPHDILRGHRTNPGGHPTIRICKYLYCGRTEHIAQDGICLRCRALLTKIRQKVRDRKLPSPPLIWDFHIRVSSEADESCAGCNAVIPKGQQGVPFEHQGQELWFHLLCYEIWATDGTP